MMVKSRQIRVLARTVVACGILALVSPLARAEFDRGQALYENQCTTCHDSLAHTRENRRVKSMDGLRRQVASWSIHSGLGWSSEEVDDVTDYLDRKFYRFGDQL
jgi:mono/diheme cytochrome c family protein